MDSQTKLSTLLLLIIFTATISSGQLKFRTQQPIEFRSSLDLNGNTISNLSDPVTADQAVPESYISSNYLSRTDPTIQGDLALSDNGNIQLRGGYLSNDGDNEGIGVLDNGTVEVSSGNLNLNGNTITNISDPVNGQDAATQSWTGSNFLYNNNPQLTSGNLDLAGGNLRLSEGYISNDGDNEGIRITDSGNTELSRQLDINNPSNTGATLDVGGKINTDAGIDSYSNIDLNSNSLTSTGGEICVGRYC